MEKSKKSSKSEEKVDATPLMASFTQAKGSTQATRTRRNASSLIERTNRYGNIDSGMVPFKYSTGYGNSSNVDVKDAVIICQKAYYNFAVFRNTIDLMTEFSVSNIYFKGGSKKSRDFFEAFFKRVNLWDFQDKFFREYYRSGNVFVYKQEGKISKREISKITQTLAKSSNVQFPIKYIILNPADVQYGGSTGQSLSKYYKILNNYELQKLKNPQTEEDVKLLKSLPPEVQKTIKTKNAVVSIPLDEEKLLTVFYKRQDYEPFAVPMGFPVMEDINWKAELKKMDMAISRCIQQAILLVTLGAEPEKGGINQKNLEAMQQLFENESVGRVLIADYTTKAQFVIPQVADILDPKKYEVVDRDILNGLNNVLFQQEKFANQSVKLNVFIARLTQARESFIHEFLIPEMKKIARLLGFKNYPTPRFDDIDLKDDVLWNRVVAQLMQLGVLTAEEGLTAIENGRLPDGDSSLQSQKKYKEHRDDGLYEPLMGGPQTQKDLADKNNDVQLEISEKNRDHQEKMGVKKMEEETKKAKEATKQKSAEPTGRPPGTSSPQSTKKVTPMGDKTVAKFAFNKIIENITLAEKLNNKITTLLKRKHKIKELSEEQVGVSQSIAEIVIINEEPKNWIKNAKLYVANPVDKKPERVKEVQEIMSVHQVVPYLAGILLASKV